MSKAKTTTVAPKATKTPEQVKADETKKAEILAESAKVADMAKKPINRNPEAGETSPVGNNPDNPKFVKASIKARKKALADMAALKAVAKADEKATNAEPESSPVHPDKKAAITKATRLEAKAKGISLMDDAGEIKTTKMLQREIDGLPKPKKLLPKGTNARRKLIKAAMNEFPETFAMVDYEGHKLSLSRDDSEADLKTEKVILAIVDNQGNVIAKHSPKMLAAIMIGKRKKGSKPSGSGKPKTSKPHVKGERQSESNIPLMMRLLREGKTQEQIFTEFRTRYTEQNVEHKDERWTWDRVVIYHKIALSKLPKDERKAVPTQEINRPKKTKTGKGSKKAAATDEAEPKTPKKGKGKKDKEPKVDGVAKAERKAKQKAKAEAADASFAALLATAEAKLEESKKNKADPQTVVRLARELKELKESNEPCVACSGKGKSSKGNVCEPCKGSGKKGMAV